MKLTCAIIDDEPLAASLLESYAMKTPFLEVKGKYNSALNAMNSLHNEPVQVLFLDIQMPELSGMEFSKMLPPETKVIFTTAFEQYAVDSYRVNALDYLLKPISYSETHPVLSLISMKMVEDMLPSSRFVRVHRSYIVQPEKIKVIERNRIVFGKEYIPISDNYKQKFFDFLAQHSILLTK